MSDKLKICGFADVNIFNLDDYGWQPLILDHELSLFCLKQENCKIIFGGKYNIYIENIFNNGETHIWVNSEGLKKYKMFCQQQDTMT